MPPPHTPRQTWDIFCRVIDNYGDAGVCWRLARQLAHRHGKSVRLWIDQLSTLQALCPALRPDWAQQEQDNIAIHLWPEDFPEQAASEVADVVIEAFACALPARYLHAMAARRPAPCWINLEYLSAETWVASCHGLASPHPQLALTKHFFFPGFSADTGGLLRDDTPENFAEHRLPAQTAAEAPQLNVFCYAHAPLPALLAALQAQRQTWHIQLSPGQAWQALNGLLEGNGPWTHGPQRIERLPFLTPAAYDALLRQGSLNIVRGEDSFVRAQLAGRPFIWHIYPQADNAHLDKLHAFLERYTADLSPTLAHTVGAMFFAWNTPTSREEFAVCWQNFIDALPALSEHARHWQTHCRQLPELSAALVAFCEGL